MQPKLRQSGIRQGFSLAEMLTALVLGSMVLVAVLSIYNRVEQSVEAIESRLDNYSLQNEVLQRIAEDIDRVIATDSDTNIEVQNKTIQGYPASMITITKNYLDSASTQRTFETITWVSVRDYQNPSAGLTLYRSYSGIGQEDPILDKNKYDWERESYIPICSGITYFNISVIKNLETVNQWDDIPPDGIVITISFAQARRMADGTMSVADEDKFTRTIAIDRTQKKNFFIEGTNPNAQR